jgi:hypothetical protein
MRAKGQVQMSAGSWDELSDATDGAAGVGALELVGVAVAGNDRRLQAPRERRKQRGQGKGVGVSSIPLWSLSMSSQNVRLGLVKRVRGT